ncbi:MAG: hypothetical protein O7C58_07755 [Rickettsia endosymbiont of Ixodes persulcatus]|nr:hypothetical protein [Rickettsia endosymbiont of Ixodes persulcatus]
MVLVVLTHHGAHGKLKLFHLEDGGFNHQRDYKHIKNKFFLYVLLGSRLRRNDILNVRTTQGQATV